MNRISVSLAMAICGVALVAPMNLRADAAGQETPAAFTANSKFYELKPQSIELGDEVTLEAWIKIDPACPEGARVLDKWAMGSQGGCRIEVGTDGGLRFVT